MLQTGIARGSALGPGNAGCQRELAVSYSILAYASKKAGDKSEALEALRQGQAIMVRMTSLSPDNARRGNATLLGSTGRLRSWRRDGWCKDSNG